MTLEESTKIIDKAYTYYDKRDWNQANELCKKAIVVFPENDEAWYLLGMTYYAKKEFTKALECFYKAIELDDIRETVLADIINEIKLKLEEK